MKEFISWVNAGEFIPPNGWKNSGIEHRIMREAGLVMESRARDPDGVGETMVKVAEVLKEKYPDEVKAAYLWAKDGFRTRAVKLHFECETRAAHQLIERGKHVMLAGYYLMKSRTYAT